MTVDPILLTQQLLRCQSVTPLEAGSLTLVADFLSALEGENLETAVSLYQDDLLPSFSCDSLLFDDWLRQERERLHQLALDALFAYAALSLTQGDYQKAQRLARRQLTLEPWR